MPPIETQCDRHYRLINRSAYFSAQCRPLPPSGSDRNWSMLAQLVMRMQVSAAEAED